MDEKSIKNHQKNRKKNRDSSPYKGWFFRSLFLGGVPARARQHKSKQKKNAIAPPLWIHIFQQHIFGHHQKKLTIFLKTMLRVRFFRQRTSQRALKNAPDFSAEFRSARAQNRAQILEPDREKKALSQSGTGSPHKCWTPRRSTPWHGGGSALCAFRYLYTLTSIIPLTYCRSSSFLT